MDTNLPEFMLSLHFTEPDQTLGQITHQASQNSCRVSFLQSFHVKGFFHSLQTLVGPLSENKANVDSPENMTVTQNTRDFSTTSTTQPFLRLILAGRRSGCYVIVAKFLEISDNYSGTDIDLFCYVRGIAIWIILLTKRRALSEGSDRLGRSDVDTFPSLVNFSSLLTVKAGSQD